MKRDISSQPVTADRSTLASTGTRVDCRGPRRKSRLKAGKTYEITAPSWRLALGCLIICRNMLPAVKMKSFLAGCGAGSDSESSTDSDSQSCPRMLRRATCHRSPPVPLRWHRWARTVTAHDHFDIYLSKMGVPQPIY